MVLLQLVDLFVGYCAPHFEQYFAFARQDFAPQLLQNMAASEELRGAIKMARKRNPGAQALRVFPVYFRFALHFRFLFLSEFCFFCLRFAFLFAFRFLCFLKFIFRFIMLFCMQSLQSFSGVRSTWRAINERCHKFRR